MNLFSEPVIRIGGAAGAFLHSHGASAAGRIASRMAFAPTTGFIGAGIGSLVGAKAAGGSYWGGRRARGSMAGAAVGAMAGLGLAGAGASAAARWLGSGAGAARMLGRGI